MEYIKCFFNERNSRCTVRLKLCSSQAWGKETDTSSEQSGRERFNRGLGWTCHRVDFSWTVQVLVLLGWEQVQQAGIFLHSDLG